MNVSRLKRALVPLFGALALLGLSTAQADSFGRTTIGATPLRGLRADFKRGSKYTLTQTGALREMCAYVDGQGSPATFDGGQYFRIVMYRDSGGVPGAKVAEAYQQYVSEGDAPRWHCDEVGIVPLTPGDYWIVLHSDRTTASDAAYNGTPIIRYYADGTGNWYGNADTFADGASNPFGAGGTGNGTLSAYARIVPHAAAEKRGAHHGRDDPFGRTPRELQAWLELHAVGGRPRHVDLRLLRRAGRHIGRTVRDDGRLQGQWRCAGRIRDRGQCVVEAGMAPRWLTSHNPKAATLQPSKYWLILHTSWQSVARYYADGTGNWYGNADDYADGPSNPFGAGGTGNGTVSAFISYEQGPFTETTVGSRSARHAATDAAGELRAGIADRNARTQRGGDWHQCVHRRAGRRLGSQRVKLVLMNGTQQDHVATEEKVIPAGARRSGCTSACSRTGIGNPVPASTGSTSQAAVVRVSHGSMGSRAAGSRFRSATKRAKVSSRKLASSSCCGWHE